MNNSIDSIPARIVVVGTSKIRLSERFNRIQKELPPQQERVAFKEDILSVNGGGQVIERPRVFNNPSSVGRKSFLHDEYMDNKLHGESSRREVSLLGRMKNDVAFRNSYKEVDTVKLSLDDYDTYQRMRPRHSFNSRFGLRPSYQNFGTYGREIEELEYYDEYEQQEDIFPANSKANYYNEPFRKPIQQRLSYKPSRISEISLRRPIRNTTVFKRPFRGRFGGFGPRHFNNSWFRRGPRQFKKNNRWNDRRFKKTVQEMDRELDEYMKSGKHPRVQPSN